MIVPALRDIQERYGYLPEEELEFLALRADVPLYRVQEVASFFPHFRLNEPPRVTVGICQSMTCHLRGAAGLLAGMQTAFRDEIEKKTLSIDGVSCLGRCDRAPVACISRHGPTREQCFHDHYGGNRGPEDLRASIADVLAGGPPPPPDCGPPAAAAVRPLWQIDVYDPRHGGTYPPFAVVRQLLTDGTPQAVIDTLKAAGLVGMGGAAARTGKKWQDVRDAPGETKYVVCNGDESEPGTFKDRELLLWAPHLVVEGVLLAGLTLNAKQGYIYLRHEYRRQIETVRQAIRDAERELPEALRRFPLEVFVSPGAYICGEETALLEAIEGRRAQPRNTPPEIRTIGLFDKPTLVNNVETFAWLPATLLKDRGKWYKQAGLRFFSLSGDVQRPGVYEVSSQTTLGQLLREHAGGLSEGLSLQAVASSGPSGGFLPRRLRAAALQQALARNLPGLRERDQKTAARVQSFCDRVLPDGAADLDVLDLELDVALFRALDQALGAGIVVYGERPGKGSAMLGHALNCLEFFAKESCGKCAPCRLGCQQLVELASRLGDHPSPPDRLREIEPTVRTLAQVMEVTSICGLGRVAANPFLTFLDHFQGQPTGPIPTPAISEPRS